jgi:hypothetical protein
MNKKQLVELLKQHGVKVVGNYVRKDDIRNLISARSKIDDYNGLWARFAEKFPKIAKKLNYVDSFWGGINSVSKFSAEGKDFLFIATPGHGWIVDMSGKVVGEEDGGFFEDQQALNKDLRTVFRNMQRVLGGTKVIAKDTTLSDAQILDLVGKAVDLSSIDASEKELLEEIADSRKHGLTIDEMVEAFQDLAFFATGDLRDEAPGHEALGSKKVVAFADLAEFEAGLAALQKGHYIDRVVNLAAYAKADTALKMAKAAKEIFDLAGHKPEGIDDILDEIITKVWGAVYGKLKLDRTAGDALHFKLLDMFGLGEKSKQ